ncbi:MAG: radical SAM protein [bacterium]|nr:MAG: radical SAM protein [bacterium]
MAQDFIPAYLKLSRKELEERAGVLADGASPCRLCPRECGVLRREGTVGYCRTGFSPVVSSAHAHFGEEAPLTGSRGSGTIFLTNCNLGCLFCQNYDISHEGAGRRITVEELANLMLLLQGQGCHNINFVTPTHQIHAIVQALVSAAERGLKVPLVYNTGGYDSVDTLRLLEGIFDIYMPDLKFSDPRVARDLADADDYPEKAREAVREMHRQVGDLVLNDRGVALRGLLVRHLVLPHDLAGSGETLKFLAEEVSADTYLNIMAQYRPCYRAIGMPRIGDRLQQKDFTGVLSLARKLGLTRLD